jgi:hypothetical protein
MAEDISFWSGLCSDFRSNIGGTKQLQMAYPWIWGRAWRLHLYDTLHELDATNSYSGGCRVEALQNVRFDG